MKMQNYSNIDEYIRSYSKSTQEILGKMRKTIMAAVPGGEEAIRYGMPTVRIGGKNLLHYAAFNDHIGFYPTPSGIKAFKKELGEYVTGKGTIAFPIDKPIPYGLVKRIAEFRAKESSTNSYGQKRAK